MPFVQSVDDKRVYYEVVGDGEYTVVLIPGWAAPPCSEIWSNQLELSSKYKILLIDLVGYGKSEKGRESNFIKLYGQDVKAVVEKLDLTNVILAGYSMGGAVMLEAEKLLSNRTIGLISIDSLLEGSTYEKMDEETTKKIIQPYEENFMQAIDNLFSTFMSDKISPKDIETWSKEIEKLDENEMISAITDMLKWDFTEVLKEINKPVKWIIAGRSLPDKELRDKHKKKYDTVFIEDVGHLVALEDPKIFNKVLDELIEELIVSSP